MSLLVLSAHLVKSPLGHHGVGRRHRHGHRNAPRRPSPPPSPPAAAASHPTTTGSQVNTFLSLGRIGQNLPGSRIWGSQSGHPQPPHPDGPLQLFSTSSPPSSPLLLQLLLQLLLGLLSCSSATHTGAAASRKQTRSTRLLTQSLHPPFGSRTLS